MAGDATAGWRVIGFDEIASASSESASRARLGLLGDSFAAAGTCVQAIGPGAGLAAATADGTVARYTPFSATTLVSDLAQCPVAIVDVGALATTQPDPTRQVERINEIERRVEQVIDAMPNGADLLVVSLADRDQQERLRLLAATGPHYAPGAARLGLDPHDGHRPALRRDGDDPPAGRRACPRRRSAAAP